MMVRTTLTLDEDLAQKIKAEMRKTGASMRDVINRLLRQGIEGPGPKKRFRVRGRAMGQLQGVNYSKTSELLGALDAGEK
jgi:negative regulator of replication initiation